MAATGASWGRRWWERPISADPTRRGKWWIGSATAAFLTVGAYVAQVELGQDLPAWAHLSILAFGAFSALLAFLLPLRQAAAARERERQTEQVATDAVTEYRVRHHAVMMPIARMAGGIVNLRQGQKKRNLEERLQQLIVDLVSENIGRGNTRACFFEYISGPPRQFVCDGVHKGKGRADVPRDRFSEGTDRGEAALRLVAEKETKFIPNVDEDRVPAYIRENADYKTIITSPVLAGDKVIGLLTVDSVEPGDLREIDRLEVSLFALALGCGLADRPIRS